MFPRTIKKLKYLVELETFMASSTSAALATYSKEEAALFATELKEAIAALEFMEGQKPSTNTQRDAIKCCHNCGYFNTNCSHVGEHRSGCGEWVPTF